MVSLIYKIGTKLLFFDSRICGFLANKKIKKRKGKTINCIISGKISNSVKHLPHGIKKTWFQTFRFVFGILSFYSGILGGINRKKKKYFMLYWTAFKWNDNFAFAKYGKINTINRFLFFVLVGETTFSRIEKRDVLSLFCKLVKLKVFFFKFS